METCPNHPLQEINNCPKCELLMSEADADRLRGIVSEMREALQEIYANYGEDKRIEKLASPLIDKTRYL